LEKWGKKRSVKRRYDLTAKMYDERYSEEQEAKYKVALEILILHGHGAVFDVGCGSGMFFAYVANQTNIVIGLDISRELLLLAKERARNFGNVFLVLADADHVPFRNGVFDYVFAFTVLQNMPSPAVTLMELQDSASPKACFVITALKSAISIEKFGRILWKAGLSVVSLRDDQALRCYVASAVRSPN